MECQEGERGAHGGGCGVQDGGGGHQGAGLFFHHRGRAEALAQQAQDQAQGLATLLLPPQLADLLPELPQLLLVGRREGNGDIFGLCMQQSSHGFEALTASCIFVSAFSNPPPLPPSLGIAALHLLIEFWYPRLDEC